MAKCHILRTLVFNFSNPCIGKIYDLFRYRKKAWTCLHIKQQYSRHGDTAFCKNLNVSSEAQLILIKFKVYKTLCIQVKIVKKKGKDIQTESRMFIFVCTYANMTSLVILR